MPEQFVKERFENPVIASMCSANTAPPTPVCPVQLTKDEFWMHRFRAVLQYTAPPALAAVEFLKVHPVIETEAVLVEWLRERAPPYVFDEQLRKVQRVKTYVVEAVESSCGV